MAVKKKVYEFERCDALMARTLISRLYSELSDDCSVFFCGTAPSFESINGGSIYNQEMRTVFSRIFGEASIDDNGHLEICINLKSCFVNDVSRLIGHYYNVFIYVPRQGISCKDFSISYHKPRRLFKKSEYKSLIAKSYFVFPEHNYFAELISAES